MEVKMILRFLVLTDFASQTLRLALLCYGNHLIYQTSDVQKPRDRITGLRYSNSADTARNQTSQSHPSRAG